MRDADLERIVKHVWRSYKTPAGKHMYVDERSIRAAIQSAIDLGIVTLNEDAPRVVPYSLVKV